MHSPADSNGKVPDPVQGQEAPAAGFRVAVPAAHLLFIDDDAYMRRLISARFEHLGARVDVAASAQACLAYLERTRPDVIVSDAVMPAMDGFDLCRHLKGDPACRDIPFIILTALTRNLAQRSLEAGADDYLSKLENDVVFRLRARLAFRFGELRRNRLAPPPADPPADMLVVSASRSLPTQLGTHLQKDGIRPREAADLAEATQELRKRVPHLLLLDLAFGQKAVMEWIMLLRDLPGCAELPVMVLAVKEDDAWLPGLEHHIQDRLLKPLDGQESRHRVALLLQIFR
jgi:two-component system cell cycle response regulator